MRRGFMMRLLDMPLFLCSPVAVFRWFPQDKKVPRPMPESQWVKGSECQLCGKAFGLLNHNRQVSREASYLLDTGCAFVVLLLCPSLWFWLAVFRSCLILYCFPDLASLACMTRSTAVDAASASATAARRTGSR